MPVHAPGVIHLIALVGKRLHQADILKKPVAGLVVFPAVAALPAIVVPPVLQEDSDGLFLAFPDDLGIGMSTANVRETSDDTENLAELVRTFPRHCERGDSAGASAADAVAFGILRDANRPTEYNSLDDRYPRVIVDELLPVLYKEYNVLRSPQSRGVGSG